jgi:hypothetical protein
MFKKCTGLWMGKVTLFPGGSEFLSHLVNGDVNDLIDIKDRNAAPKVCKAVFYAIMNLFTHM